MLTEKSSYFLKICATIQSRMCKDLNRATKKNTAPGLYVPKTVLCNAPPGARTLDTLIKSQVLYQLS